MFDVIRGQFVYGMQLESPHFLLFSLTKIKALQLELTWPKVT